MALIRNVLWSYNDDDPRGYTILLKLLNMWTGKFTDSEKYMKILTTQLISEKCIHVHALFLSKIENILLRWAAYRYTISSLGIITVARLSNKFNTKQTDAYNNLLPYFYSISHREIKRFMKAESYHGKIMHNSHWGIEEQKEQDPSSFLESLSPENLNTILTLGIFRAPRCNREFTVFRYSSDARLLHQKEHGWISPMFARIGKKITFGTIQSVAYDWNPNSMNHIIKLSEGNYCYQHCCIQVIRVPKNFPFLFIGYLQSELLLPAGTVCRVLGFRKISLDRKDPIPVKNKEINLEQRKEWLKNICEKKKDIAVVDMEIVGLDENLTRIEPVKINEKLLDKSYREKLNKKLHTASEEGDLASVKKYVKKGADIVSNDNRALKKSSKNGHLDIVKYLVEHGADITDDDEPISLASEKGHLEVVKYLASQGANVDAAVYSASKKGQLEIVKLLADQCSDIDTAIYLAKKKGHTNILNFLQKRS